MDNDNNNTSENDDPLMKLLQGDFCDREREKKKEKNAKYRANNREEIKESGAKYRAENPEKIKEKNAKYYAENAEEIRGRHAKYRAKNPEKIREINTNWRRSTEGILYFQSKSILRRMDPKNRIIDLISRHTHQALHNNGIARNGKSFLKLMHISKAQLQLFLARIQREVESYGMTIEQIGLYDPKTWNDNDPKTWTYQIDHILPVANYDFTEEDAKNNTEAFRIVCGINNLRVLPSKYNILRSNNETYKMPEHIQRIADENLKRMQEKE